MKHISVLLVFMLAACSAVQGTETAQRAVTQFHSSYNQAQFTQIYSLSDPALKDASSPQEFVDFMQAVHRKMGKVKSAKRTGSGVNVSTFGTQVSLSYETEFEQGVGVEQFTWRVKGDAAHLVNYNINSRFLIMN